VTGARDRGDGHRGDMGRGGTDRGGTACGDARRALGVYVLGAIEPEDRGTLERHLARCASCREELGRLADLPGWLSKVPPDEAERLLDDRAGEGARPGRGGTAAPGRSPVSWPRPGQGARQRAQEDKPPGPGPGRPGHAGERAGPGTRRPGPWTRRPGRGKRGRGAHGQGEHNQGEHNRSRAAHGHGEHGRAARWWRRAGLAAAAVIMGAGAVVASRALYPSPARPAVAVQHWAATVRGQNPLMHVGLIVRYASMPWGLALDVRVSGIPAGTRCELLVVNSRGQRVPAGGWLIAADDERARYPASSSVRTSAIRGFLVTSAGRPLVTARPETYRQ
jgi:Putative zinc-finger